MFALETSVTRTRHCLLLLSEQNEVENNRGIKELVGGHRADRQIIGQ